MTIQIDTSEVLYHLNTFGIQYIEESAFEQFIKDLKKLIKHERRKKEIESLHGSRTNTHVQFQEHEINCKHRRRREDNVIPKTNDVHDRISARSIVEHHASISRNEKEEKHDHQCSRSCDSLPDTDRPISSLSYAKSASTNIRKKKHNSSPVELYHYYQSIWKHHKLPGENDHAQLRRAIRNRLMNAK